MSFDIQIIKKYYLQWDYIKALSKTFAATLALSLTDGLERKKKKWIKTEK